MIQAIRHQMAVPLHPPRAIVGNRRLVLDFVVETGEQNGGHCQEKQQDGGKPSLKFAVHNFGPSSRFTDWDDGAGGGVARRSSPIRHMQLHCHLPISPRAAKSLLNSDFHNYRDDLEWRL